LTLSTLRTSKILIDVSWKRCVVFFYSEKKEKKKEGVIVPGSA
jgi:hypothetical protein